jgi:hypothetical protein
MSAESGVRYRINEQDEIIFVDEAWNDFATANDGPELVRPRVLGRILWDFVGDGTTLLLYQQIVANVRQGGHALFTLRCDCPSYRRLLEMTVNAHSKGVVEFATRVLQVEPQSPVALLRRQTPRTNELLRTCSWCNRLELAPHTWIKMNDAVSRLQLLEAYRLPQLTHGICSDCFTAMSDEVETMTKLRE